MTREFHPMVKQVLDGERAPTELPPELRGEAEEALRMLAAVDRRSETLSPAFETRVMGEVRRLVNARRARAMSAPVVWRWLTAPTVPRWVVGAVALAALVLVLVRPARVSGPTGAVATAAAPESVFVRFVLFAPEAQRVTLAGTFNRWDPGITSLTRVGDDGVWAVTLALPPGQHQYTFVVDGQRWVTDPAAPAVDDGFGRKNSVVSVSAAAGRAL